MRLLEQIHNHALHFPERIAVRNGADCLTWRELEQFSDRLAVWIGQNQELTGAAEAPIAVYGHKDPWMLVCFLACIKAGHAYCPIDTSLPGERIRMILDQLPSRIFFAPEAPVKENDTLLTSGSGADPAHTGLEFLTENRQDKEKRKQPVPREKILEITAEPAPKEQPVLQPVSGSRTWYIIFTSGSTGTPKGVQISADCLEHFLDWSVGLAKREDCVPEDADRNVTEDRENPENRKNPENPEKSESMDPGRSGMVFLNQAPFSFDLSVMDLYTSLALGGTLWCLDKKVQGDYTSLMDSLEKSGANVWVSTPSFAQMCLSERTFDRNRMPALRTFLFCGETLDNRTALKLMERFPDAAVYNTYGPTESTVAVTGVRITKEMAQAGEPLPVGTAKSGTLLRIQDPEGKLLPDGESGEIIIIGDTVSTGYYQQKELSEKAFFCVPGKDGTGLRAYRTGDKGFLQAGMLHYRGRIDFQVKLHGYRIELEDIENNIRNIPGVAQAVVLPNERGGKVSSLTAYVTLDTEDVQLQSVPELPAFLKEQLSHLVPAYMVPKKWEVLDEIPVTPNGKADRKALRMNKTGGQGQ